LVINCKIRFGQSNLTIFLSTSELNTLQKNKFHFISHMDFSDWLLVKTSQHMTRNLYK